MKLLSLFDYTGNWAQPFADAGWDVVLWDIKHSGTQATDKKIGIDLMQANERFLDQLGPIDGILAAVPCTDFASSGARWFAAKDADGRTAKSVALVKKTLEIIDYLNPAFWVIENPIGRIHNLVPELGKPKMYFQPCDYGDPYTKRTALWGNFNSNLIKTPVEPTEGSKMWRLYGGKSERTKAARSATPMGFARAFFEANKHPVK